jgi:hypothetical protein
MGPKTGDPTFSDESADEAAQDVGALPDVFVRESMVGALATAALSLTDTPVLLTLRVTSPALSARRETMDSAVISEEIVTIKGYRIMKTLHSFVSTCGDCAVGRITLLPVLPCRHGGYREDQRYHRQGGAQAC